MPLSDAPYAQYIKAEEPQKDPRLFDYKKTNALYIPKDKRISGGLQGIYQALNAIDWAQTRNLARSPDKYHEEDAAGLIGHHPHKDTVDAYFALNALLHFIAPKVLPEEIDQLLKTWKISDKVNVIGGNERAGIKMRF